MAEVYGYPRRAVVRDLALVGTVAALLVVVHAALPAGARNALALRLDVLDPVALYTSSLVHADGSHLANNVAGYVAAALAAHGLALRARRRRWFLRTFGALLVVLPAAVGLTSWLVLARLATGLDGAIQGFSGVGAGFAGFLFVALVGTLRAEYGRPVGTAVGLALWLLFLLELAVIYARWVVPVAALLVVPTWAFCLGQVVAERGMPGPGGLAALLGGDAVQYTVAAALLVVFVPVLFPQEVVRGGAVTNVFAHAAGFLYGTGLAACGWARGA